MLSTGYHDIVIEHYDFGGASSLTARMSGADTEALRSIFWTLAVLGRYWLLKPLQLSPSIQSSYHDDPVTSGIPNQVSSDFDVVTLDASSFFNDVDGDTLTFSASGLPAGLSIDSTTGVISGQIDNSASQNEWRFLFGNGNCQ